MFFRIFGKHGKKKKKDLRVLSSGGKLGRYILKGFVNNMFLIPQCV